MIKRAIEDKLAQAFPGDVLSVIDESHQHHRGGSETHFRIEIVSEKFLGLTLLKRHRLVSDLLSQELSRIHASSLHTFTVAEFEKKNGKLSASPLCAGVK